MLPANLVVKGSAVLGAANPIGIKLLQENGLDTINVASDITLPRLAALRQVISIPIDLYIEGPDGLGGFTRYYEMAEVVRIAAPVYLKFGLRNAPNIYPSGVHLEGAAVATGRERCAACRDRHGTVGAHRRRIHRLSGGRTGARHPSEGVKL